jgi:hypothetical protein
MPIASAALRTALDTKATSDADPTIVTVELKFEGVTFDPVDLYDALNAQWATITTEKDSVGGPHDQQHDYQFLITT